jgi:phage tail protein X
MDLKSLTDKKVAGIPVIYLILGVTVIALYGAIKIKPAPAPADTADTGTDGTAGDLPDTSQPVFSATPTITQPSGVATSVSAVSGPDTDDLWKRRAIDYLRQNGYTLDVATAAINKYLDGQALSVTEAGARDKAVGVFGLPPEGIPDTSTTPNPTTTTLPTTPNYNGPATRQGSPPTTHIVRGKSDDTYDELARLYYGRSTPAENLLIRSYNPTHTGGPFPVGTRITVPRFVQPKWYNATSATHTAVAIARKNGTTAQRIRDLNLRKDFPVKPGTRVRVR